MGAIKEYIKSAIASIKENKGRSFLTMLGIIIGIAAVLAILVIGDGVKAMSREKLADMEVTTIDVELDNLKTDKFFTPDNMTEIERSLNSIYGVSPGGLHVNGSCKGYKGAYDVYLSGGSEALGKNVNNKILYGHYFSKDDVEMRNYVCVLSQSASKMLFGYESAVGETFEVTEEGNTKEFTVIGIREDTDEDTYYAKSEDFRTVLGDTPYTTIAEAYNLDVNASITSFTAYVDNDKKDIANLQMKPVVENVLGLRGEDVVKVTPARVDAASEGIINILTAVVALVAMIALVVGGIGVMNIMTVSVTERTREIGIRKSLGARTSYILIQFLAEASILTSIGGVVGIVVGLSIAKIACTLLEISFVINPVIVTAVVGVSVMTGLFFGINPARRAAKLNPIEALRSV